jgi:hypothetical protein
VSASCGKFSTFGATAILCSVVWIASCLSTSELTGGRATDGGLPGTVIDGETVENPCGADLIKDKTNCGKCGNICPINANGYPECIDATCTTSCNTGFGDCDGANANGCESDLGVDSKNCGRCGRSCLGGACVAGQCQAAVAANVTGRATGVAVDDGFVYFGYTGAGDGNGISRFPKADGMQTPQTVVDKRKTVTQIEVAGDFVYWTEPATGGYPPTTADGALYRKRKDGSGAVETVASALLITTESVVRVRENTAYFTVQGDKDVSDYPSNAQIASCPVTGCAAVHTVLATGANVVRPAALAVGATHLYFSTKAVLPSPAPSAVYRCKIAGCGGAPELIQKDTTSVTGMEVQGTNLYYATSTMLSVVPDADKAGAKPTSLASALSGPRWLALDNTDVHWVTFSTQGNVQSCAMAGCQGVPHNTATGQAFPHSIATDAVALYWSLNGNVNASATSIMKAAK